MHELVGLVVEYGLLLVFANVLLEQLGAPVPAIPTLVVTGALAADGKLSPALVLGVAVLASALSDGIWFVAGRRYGHRVLKTLCRVSLSPDSCVSQTETIFERWGAGSLLVAKFVPGFSTVAPPLAGAMGLRSGPFLLYDSLGAALWAGAGIGVGMLFHDQIDRVFDFLDRFGASAVVLLGALLGAFIAFKWWERRRFYKALRMARISVADLHRLASERRAPVIVDVRSSIARQRDPRRIPGARAMSVDELDERLAGLPIDRDIVLYCNCPNEASAAHIARLLMDRGFRRVRPLEGGLDAWAAAGLPVEEDAVDVFPVPERT